MGRRGRDNGEATGGRLGWEAAAQRGLQPDAPRGAQGALGTGCSSCAGPAEADSPAPAKDKRKRHTLRGRRRPRPLQRSWRSVIPTGAAGGSGDGAPRRTLVRHSDELETLQVPVIRSSRQINHVLSTSVVWKSEGRLKDMRPRNTCKQNQRCRAGFSPHPGPGGPPPRRGHRMSLFKVSKMREKRKQRCCL